MENTQDTQMNNVTEATTFSEPNVTKEKAEVMSLGEWVIIILITAIPIVNLVMLFVWAFSKGENPNKRNWARANLIWMGIGIVLAIIIFSSMMAFFSSMFESNTVNPAMINPSAIDRTMIDVPIDSNVIRVPVVE